MTGPSDTGRNNPFGQEIEKADIRLRSVYIAIGTVIIIILGVVVFYALPRLMDQLKGHIEQGDWAGFDQTIQWIRYGMPVLFIPMVIFGVWMIRNGFRIVRSSRFPAPGMRVIRDTPVIHGGEARARGVMLVILGFITVLVGAAAMWLSVTLVDNIVSMRHEKNEPDTAQVRLEDEMIRGKPVILAGLSRRPDFPVRGCPQPKNTMIV